MSRIRSNPRRVKTVRRQALLPRSVAAPLLPPIVTLGNKWYPDFIKGPYPEISLPSAESHELRLVFACTQRPFLGGASTEFYEMIKLFRSHGHKVLGLFLDRSQVPNWWDPDQLGNVYPLPFSSDIGAINPIVIKKLQAFNPQVVLGKNILAPTLIKKIFPNAKVIYVTSGFGYIVTEYSKLRNIRGIDDFVVHYTPEQRKSVLNDGLPCEGRTIALSDKIIFHSDTVRAFLPLLFPEAARKGYREIIWTSNILISNQTGPPWEQRSIDLLFVASNWGRGDKGGIYMRDICARYRSSRCTVVGQNSSLALPNVRLYENLSRMRVLQLMGESKVLIVPSLFDASPNIVPEAIGCGCNIVLSQNVRNYFLCNPALIVENLDLDRFCTKIDLALKSPYLNPPIDKTKIYKQMLNAIEEVRG